MGTLGRMAWKLGALILNSQEVGLGVIYKFSAQVLSLNTLGI